MSYGILFDVTRCIGCEACMDACHESHGQPETTSYELSEHNYTVVQTRELPDEEEVYIRRMCMHCEDPSCASACPVGAFTKTPEGPVTYDGDKCIGCRYCMVACPFEVPKYQWGSLAPVVRKCDMCYDRIKEGGIPACAEACEEGATVFGEREELIALARQRMKDDPDSYHPYIYGLNEAGGTSMLFLTPVPPEELGYQTAGMNEVFPNLTGAAMKEIPNIFSFSGVFLYGLWWVINRRMKLQKMDPDGTPVHEEESVS